MSGTDTMEAGRGLDALVSDAVFPGDMIAYMKPFSTDIAVAWRVVEAMNCDRGYVVRINNEDDEWTVRFIHMSDYDIWGEAYAPTAPLAICRAALKALEKARVPAVPTRNIPGYTGYTPTGQVAPAALPDTPPRPSRARGRPARLTAQGLFDWYHANIDASNVVMQTRRDVANALGVCTRTIARLEAVLSSSGLIQRTVSASRRTSSVILSVDKNTQEAEDA